MSEEEEEESNTGTEEAPGKLLTPFRLPLRRPSCCSCGSRSRSRRSKKRAPSEGVCESGRQKEVPASALSPRFKLEHNLQLFTCLKRVEASFGHKTAPGRSDEQEQEQKPISLTRKEEENEKDCASSQMMVKNVIKEQQQQQQPLVYVRKKRERRKLSARKLFSHTLLVLVAVATYAIINHQECQFEQQRRRWQEEEESLHRDNTHNGQLSDKQLLLAWPTQEYSKLKTEAQTNLNLWSSQVQTRWKSYGLLLPSCLVRVVSALEPETIIVRSGELAQRQHANRSANNILELPKQVRTSTKPNSKLLKTSINNNNNNNNKRNSFIKSDQNEESANSAQSGDFPEVGATSDANYSQSALQISITSRLSLIRVPVDSNAILKCLISSQASKFTKKFKVHWSRYMYDENVYEQIESFSAGSEPETSSNAGEFNHSPSSEEVNKPDLLNGNDEHEIPFNRQQQLRDFLTRTRQETNVINELLIEATLSISPVKATDNASYYCTATDGMSDQKARIDLVALSRPVVQLERVFPARDSKSALIYWIIISDGNAPIKKTILMVKNDTTTTINKAASSLIPLFSVPNNNKQETAVLEQQQQPIEGDNSGGLSSVVIDSDYNQWQRIEIPQDGEPISGEQMMMTTHTMPGSASSSSSSSSSTSAFESWLGGESGADVDVVSSPIGNGQVKSSQAEVYSGFSGFGSSKSRWKLNRFNRRQRSFNLSSLLPGVTYNFRMAAINDMGQSNWTQMVATMPNEIPAQISEVVLLSRSNNSLLIGWRRPSYDGAKTIRYEMQLFDLNRTIEMNANTNTSTTTQREKFFYLFRNLNSGTDYHFHVRACSKAGCSSFSNPKLLATTLDGEADEPLDVELTCELESGNITVSWLPPVNSRGQLTNFSVLINSQARFKNTSGEWTLDEWRTTMETFDNHTLSLEAAKILLPNTNYSVRVCANNRSKQCGRLSAVSTQTQCSTPPELPLELPNNIRLTTKSLDPKSLPFNNLEGITMPTSVEEGDEQERKAQPEALLLELPFLALRNGSIDCIQVVLIRLPKSFTGDSSLEQFLPTEARDIKLSHLIDLYGAEQQQNKSAELAVENGQQEENNRKTKGALVEVEGENQKAVAYLAEEVELVNQVADNDTSTSSTHKMHQIILGDGFQNSCQSLKNDKSLLGGGFDENQTTSTLKTFRVFDGALKAQTYYTGFIKLVLVRQVNKNNIAGLRGNEKRPQVLTKYSNYFNPVKTGDLVIEVPVPNSNDAIYGTGVQLTNPFSIDSQMNFQEMANKLGSSLKITMSRLYNSTSSFVWNSVNLERLGDYIYHSTPLMQVFHIGLIVLVLCLLILFVLYLMLLPASMRRKRKTKMKKKLQQQRQQQQQQQQQQQIRLESSDQNYLNSKFKNNQPEEEEAVNFIARADETNDLGQLVSNNEKSSQMLNVGYNHQVEPHSAQNNPAQLYSGQPQARECPIHSSPLARQQQVSGEMDRHVCQVSQVSQQQPVAYVARDPNYGGQMHYAHHHHTLHHKQQLANNYSTNQELARQEHERNCRTTRRVNAQNGIKLEMKPEMMSNSAAMAHQAALKNTYTLNHQNSVLALAKKINKSIPIRLFGPVFECRLRNGWLREEYEQLPRQAVWGATSESSHMMHHQQQTNGKLKISKTPNSNLVLKLRPQLVVSRNDIVSALISGNDQYDASLIKLQMPTDSLLSEKRIICAKSPLDADSVWDFWRLVYEQSVNTIVMLTQNEDQNTGEMRCAQYWPTCDNEETTILSPCNEYVQKSNILPAKFKIRQETFEEESRENDFKVRRLTLIVMATRPGENEQQEENVNQQEGGKNGDVLPVPPIGDDDEEELVIIERNIIHLQFYHWNTGTLINQMRLIKFIEMANERHLKSRQQQESPITTNESSSIKNNNNLLNSPSSPMLVHCFNGLGRSGLFAAMSFIIDDLALKLNYEQQLLQHHLQHHHHQQQERSVAKLNLFQLVSRLRSQREMLLSPYRFYELLYQLTCNCIPTQPPPLPTSTTTTSTTNTAQELPAQIGARLANQ